MYNSINKKYHESANSLTETQMFPVINHSIIQTNHVNWVALLWSFTGFILVVAFLFCIFCCINVKKKNPIPHVVSAACAQIFNICECLICESADWLHMDVNPARSYKKGFLFFYKALILLCCTGNVGGTQRARQVLCHQSPEERCSPGGRWCGVHHDREASVSSGLQSSIPHPPPQHLPVTGSYYLYNLSLGNLKKSISSNLTHFYSLKVLKVCSGLFVLQLGKTLSSSVLKLGSLISKSGWCHHFHVCCECDLELQTVQGFTHCLIVYYPTYKD